MMQFCKHVFPEFTIDDMLILCSTAAVEMGYFTNYEFQWHNIMALKFISTSFHLFCSLNISTSLSRSLSVRVSFPSFTRCIMASILFCDSLVLEFVHTCMSFIRPFNWLCWFQVILLLEIQTDKFIALPIFSQFTLIIYMLIFTILRYTGPQI